MANNTYNHQLGRRSLLLDLLEVGQQINYALQSILANPPTGVYLPCQLEPVLTPDKPYWYEVPRVTNATSPVAFCTYDWFPVTNLQEVIGAPWDVVTRPDGMGVVALPHHMSKNATLHPQIAYYGTKVAIEMVDNDIRSTRAYAQHPPLVIEEILLPYVLPQYQNLNYLKEEEVIQKMLDAVYDDLLETLRPARNFLRDNPYQMCELNVQQLDCVRIDQLGDIRIHEWHQHKASGAWK